MTFLKFRKKLCIIFNGNNFPFIMVTQKYEAPKWTYKEFCEQCEGSQKKLIAAWKKECSKWKSFTYRVNAIAFKFPVGFIPKHVQVKLRFI